MTIPLGLGISEWAVTVTFRCLIGKRCATRQDLLLRTSDSGQPVRPESEMATIRQVELRDRLFMQQPVWLREHQSLPSSE